MAGKAVVKEAPKIKRFGGGADRSQIRHFEIIAYKDEEEVPLQFSIRISAESTDLIQFMAVSSQKGADEEAVGALLRAFRKIMVNNDGIPAGWSVSESLIKPKEKGELPDSFRGPDGKIYKLTDTEKIEEFQDIEKGSSRRRWNYLMMEDDELTVQISDLMEAAQWAISEASNRPT